MIALATVGGQSVSVIAFITILLANYQEFYYQMEVFRTLYFERQSAEDEDDHYETDWRRDLRAKFESRHAFDQTYFTYAAFNIIEYICCCCTKKWGKKKGSWYWRQKRIGDKLEIAQELFNSEVDLQRILSEQRISKFLSKLQTNKRQRASVGYFRKYTIEDHAIKTFAEKQRRNRQSVIGKSTSARKEE